MRGTWQTTDSGGGGLVLAVIAAAVLIGSGAASAIASALVTILIIVAVVVGLVLVGGVALLVHRAGHVPKSATAWPISAPPVHQLPAEVRPQLERREVHLHFHGTDPVDVAALIHRINDRSNP